jgi:hypothetical protein
MTPATCSIFRFEHQGACQLNVAPINLRQSIEIIVYLFDRKATL